MDKLIIWKTKLSIKSKLVFFFLIFLSNKEKSFSFFLFSTQTSNPKGKLFSSYFLPFHFLSSIFFSPTKQGVKEFWILYYLIKDAVFHFHYLDYDKRIIPLTIRFGSGIYHKNKCIRGCICNLLKNIFLTLAKKLQIIHFFKRKIKSRSS